MSDKKTKLNIFVAFFFKFILLVLAIFTKRYLIMYCGDDTNGINNLFLNVIGVLTVADLGISSAIIFEMYKPAINKDFSKLAALYYLYRKVFKIIALIIFILGLLIMPFLPVFMQNYKPEFNTNIAYFLILLSIVIGYFSSSDQALLISHRNDFISTSIISFAGVL